ncbi:valine--tRNA ligase [Octadecabacter sp. 1_MG-2023]|uniref:valine--tRNA ligase n=1 Tax=unclassified Octadecabacter TaxID=196158 RepID=UPI001C09648F|nr:MULTISPECIES: valine--tRNA ligase [unclassified Octadecabacter]MBU2992662.1 valine--tRNA ligase [Octadecabacter sp. B2R22]MDO6733887.1 valine--tRNA ligase [Octadecabacter sp. 1_MG-2023]
MPMEKKFDAHEAEARITDRWLSADAFKAGANAKRDDTYCVMIPPPNVTGVLHMGHAFNNTLQDILVRWHRMRGFDTLWQPGTDHAGIATQMVVERKLAENGEPKRTELGREKFLEKVWEWKGESGGQIINQLKRLGASCDWAREAFTMSGAPGAPADAQGNFHDAVIKVFVEMYNKGLIYRGKRLVNWDPHFETAISDLEVENVEVDGHMWHFKYPLAGGATYTYEEKDEDGNVILSEERNYISIATTRPETMLGDGAVAVNPRDERYAPIIGKLCEIPVGPKESRRLIPIITDDYPDMEFGSGAVKITGAHDFNDYMVAKRGGIPMYSLMDTKGAMRADGKPYVEEAATAQAIANGEQEFDESMIAAMNLVPDAYRGLDRFEAREKVIADITAEGLAVMHDVTRKVKNDDGEKVDVTETVPMVENKKIMQPFGDRSKVVIEPMLTDQWFVETDKIVKPALDAVKDGTVKILPESGEKTYYHWLENIEPWCISRQLWWGHQIPVWYYPGQNDWFSVCAATEEEAIAKAMAQNVDGTEFRIVADVLEATAVLEEQLKLLDTRDEGTIRTFEGPMQLPMFRDPDVLDTWFSSGLWPIGTLGWPEETDELAKYFPTSDLITGQDILFFWVARMMMMQLAVVGDIPFDTIYLHGLVRDAKGKKMSKSTGNVIDPLDIIDEYGADALRFTNAAMASLGGALKLDTQRIAGYRNFGTKLWNACRFAEMNGAFGADRAHTGPISDPYPTHITQSVNKWIIGETATALADVNAALDTYRFNDAADTLYKFVWGKVCDWYVELSKPLLMDGSDAEKLETQQVMNWVLNQCLILMHPIMPFITEELWALDGNTSLLVHQDWPEYGADLIDAQADSEMSWVIQIIENIRSTRAQMNVPAGLYVPLIQTEADDAAKAAWAGNEALIKRLARVDSLTVGAAPKGSMMVGTKGATFALPLADIIDVDAEKARITKSLGKVEKEAGGLRGRLGNPKFAENATAEVVEEAKANLALRTEEIAQLSAALAQLNEI